MLKEQHLHETLWRLETERARRRAYSTPVATPGGALSRSAARAAGRALIRLGARLLNFGGEGARVHIRAARTQADLAYYTTPGNYSRN